MELRMCNLKIQEYMETTLPFTACGYKESKMHINNYCLCVILQMSVAPTYIDKLQL